VYERRDQRGLASSLNDDIPKVRYTLWYTLRGREERRFHKAEFPGIDARDWLPAAADLQVRVVEPLFSLLKTRLVPSYHGPTRIDAGDSDPDADTLANLRQGPAEVGRAIAENPKYLSAPIDGEALRRLCGLAHQYRFGVRVVWPPMPSELEQALLEHGALTHLQPQMRAVMQDHCLLDDGFDFNRVRTYTASSFHNDMIHLFGDGWEQRYASDLRDFLTTLVDRSVSARALDRQLAP
jgi:hypothetical protein